MQRRAASSNSIAQDGTSTASRGPDIEDPAIDDGKTRTGSYLPRGMAILFMGPSGSSDPARPLQTAPLSVSLPAHLTAVILLLLTVVWIFGYRGGVAWVSENKSLIFNWHPILMVLGMLVLFGQGMMAYRIVPSASRDVRKRTHAALNFASFIVSVVGVYAAFKFHNEAGFTNLYSFHSWSGMLTIVLFGMQWLYGLVCFLYPGMAPETRSASLPWHVFVGFVLFILAIATASQGLVEKMSFLYAGGVSQTGPEMLVSNLLGLSILAFGIAVVYVMTQMDGRAAGRSVDGFQPIN